MSVYEQIIKWLENNWITAIILLVAVGLIALPKVRDGAVLLWSWIASPFKKKSTESKTLTYKVMGEEVTYAELLRTIQQDVVKVNAHTHPLGVAAEYKWIEKRYPGSETLKQSLTTLDLIEGKKNYKSGSIHFDQITIRLADGRTKDIYFDISSFFDGESSSIIDPDGFIAKKISSLYRK